jgi:Spy/CpxP family protein refolding chaperone
MKKLIVSVAVLITLILTSNPAMASQSKGGHQSSDCQQCPLSKSHAGKKSDLSSTFFHKAHMVLGHADELGLSEDQVKRIKDLKMAVKKDLIRQDAEIEVLAIDIESNLRAYPMDVEATNALVDQKYNLKKANTKSLVSSFANLKSILTKDQYTKLKDLYKN